MKKSQIEMAGLVIIVIIISLIILFVLRALMEKPQSTVQLGEITKLSSDWVNAMLQTNSQCFPHTGPYDPKLDALLIDCVKYYNSGGNIICSDGKKSCESVNTAIKSMLNKTLLVWNIPYTFKVNLQNQEPLIYFSNVTAPSGGDVTPYSLPIYPSGQIIEIWLCVGGCKNNADMVYIG